MLTVRTFGPALALLLTSTVCNAAPTINLKNSIAQCYDIELGEPIAKARGRYAVMARFSMKSELSECGCTSRFAAYVVSAGPTETAHEHFVLRGDTQRQLDLGRAKAPRDHPLELWIGCAGA